MSTTIDVRWGDGYTTVSPVVPDELMKELKYYHRSLDFDERLMRRISTGTYRLLYDLKETIDPTTHQFTQTLTTLPGFTFRIKEVLKKAGLPHRVFDSRTPPPEQDLPAAFSLLRDYQYECVYTALMSGGGIISCPTGWGKTYVMSAIIQAYRHEEMCARNTPTIIVAAPDKDIVEKNYKKLVELLPDRDVGLVMSGRKKLFSDDVQVITLDSLHLIEADSIGIVIADEVHAAASEKRADTIMASRKALRWGVSATPIGRFDGRDKVTEGIFGPVVYKRTYQEGVADGALVPIRVFWIKMPEPDIGLDTFKNYKRRDTAYRRGMYRNESAQRIISDVLLRTPEEMQTLCIMQHLDQMNQLVPMCPGIEYVHGQQQQAALRKSGYTNLAPVTKKERTAAYSNIESGKLRKVLSTWVYKQGVDFPELQMIMNAGGGGSDIVAQQIPGRESRSTDGKTESYLVDFYHEWDWNFDEDKGRRVNGFLLRDDQSREKAYTELGFDQVWLDDINELPFLNEE